MQALAERQTQRKFSSKELNLQTISDLLWAAFGINRPASGRRTAPSAVNWQETDIYVVMPDAAYIYDAVNNTLQMQIQGDYRENMAIQSMVKDAPLILAYVADYKKMGALASKEDKDFYAAVDCGYISQNVYLFCASENLATVVLGYINRTKIAETLKLKDHQKVILTQPVAYPAE